MTARHLRLLAAAIALAVQIALVVTYGAVTNGCFCSVTGMPAPPVPPPFVMRFMELAVLPTAWMTKGLALPILFVQNLIAWTLALVVLLHGLALAARIRIRPVRGTDGRRTWLASSDRLRPAHVLLLGCLVIGVGLASGAMMRRRWLSEAERVFTAAMAAASAGRPLPPRVEHFSMHTGSGDAYRQVIPEPRFVAWIDPAKSGHHFLDRFVAPYGYGGVLRFESGERWEFDVFRRGGGWSIYLDEVR